MMTQEQHALSVLRAAVKGDWLRAVSWEITADGTPVPHVLSSDWFSLGGADLDEILPGDEAAITACVEELRPLTPAAILYGPLLWAGRRRKAAPVGLADRPRFERWPPKVRQKFTECGR